jgi:hypothetical protein
VYRLLDAPYHQHGLSGNKRIVFYAILINKEPTMKTIRIAQRNLANQTLGHIGRALQCLRAQLIEVLCLGARTRTRARTSGAAFNGYA